MIPSGHTVVCGSDEIDEGGGGAWHILRSLARSLSLRTFGRQTRRECRQIKTS